MVNLHAGTHAFIQIVPAKTSSTSSLSSSLTSSSQALTDELSQAFSAVLEQFGIDPNSIKLTFQTDSGQNTTSDSGQDSNSSAAAASTSSGASQLGLSALFNVNTPSSTAASVTSSPAPAKHWYAANAFDDAYWSKQPAAVQELREIQDPAKRQALAEQLSGQGYQIDNAIMVWGWDPEQVTAIRQSAGYTWVPSAGEDPIGSAPGATVPGITPYDPSNPPKGSILVG